MLATLAMQETPPVIGVTATPTPETPTPETLAIRVMAMPTLARETRAPATRAIPTPEILVIGVMAMPTPVLGLPRATQGMLETPPVIRVMATPTLATPETLVTPEPAGAVPATPTPVLGAPPATRATLETPEMRVTPPAIGATRAMAALVEPRATQETRGTPEPVEVVPETLTPAIVEPRGILETLAALGTPVTGEAATPILVVEAPLATLATRAIPAVVEVEMQELLAALGAQGAQQMHPVVVPGVLKVF